MTSPTDNDKAGVFRRLAAMVYDSLLILAILMVLFTIFVGLNDWHLIEGQFYKFIFVLTIIAFYSWFWLHGGQTLGMVAWRIKLKNIDGSPPTLKQCLLRLLLACLSLGSLGIGYFWLWLDKDKRTFHDIFSKTDVIVLAKYSKNKQSSGSLQQNQS